VCVHLVLAVLSMLQSVCVCVCVYVLCWHYLCMYSASCFTNITQVILHLLHLVLTMYYLV
jgi:hypothetical protein